MRAAPGRVVRDPAGRGAICVPCGAYWPSTTRAALCHPTPIVPGVSMRPARPPYVPADAVYVPFTPHTYGPDRTRRFRLAIVVGVFLVIASVVGLAVLAGVRTSGPAPLAPPTTYGPPASTGGPVMTR